MLAVLQACIAYGIAIVGQVNEVLAYTGTRVSIGGVIFTGQSQSTSMIASAKACGASCGRLCPMPPSTTRCWYLPVNLLA
jgi:hypothetical protein